MNPTTPGITWDDERLVEQDGRPVLVGTDGPIVSWQVTGLVLDATPVDPEPSALDWELDEVTERFVAGPVQVSLRHSLDRTWNIRILLTNTGDHPVMVDRLGLGPEPGPQWIGWVACEGAEASVAMLSSTRRAILGFSLLQGELRSPDLAGAGPIEIGGLVLEPGGRHVVSLRGDWYDGPAPLARTRPNCVPAWDWWEVGAVVGLEHPDQALVGHRTTPEGIGLEPHEHDWATEIEGVEPARIHLELAGPRGRVEVDLGFAPSVDELVAAVVARAEARWPRGRQGMRLDALADAVVLQRHAQLAAGGRLLQSDVEDALDGLVGRIDDDGAFAVAVLAGRAVLTGDRDLAERATRALARMPGDQCRALVLGQVMGARQVVGLDPRSGIELTAPAPEVGDDLATRLSRSIEDPAGREAVLTELGVHWGLGLRGRRWGGTDLVGEARLVAIGCLMTELGPPASGGGAIGFEELLEQHHRRVRGEVWSRIGEDASVAVEALAWLVLAPPVL